MPKPTSAYANHSLVRAPKHYIRVDRNQGPALDAALAEFRSLPTLFLLTARTGSKSGQHAVIRTNYTTRLRLRLAGIPGIDVQTPDDYNV